MKKELFQFAASKDVQQVITKMGTSSYGLNETSANAIRERDGANLISRGTSESLLKRILKAFINPFTTILIALATVSMFTVLVGSVFLPFLPMSSIQLILLNLIYGL